MTMTEPTAEQVAEPVAEHLSDLGGPLGPPPGAPTLRGPNDELISVEDVTPERAKELLALNTENYRRLRRSLVKKYARDMATPGGWIFTADKIGVNRDGVLSDGQNRLAAQIDAGVTLPWLIAWNLLPEATRVMDGGAARTAADHLHHMQIPNAVVVAALARLIIQDRPNRRGTAISTTEVANVVDENRALVAIATKATGLEKLGKIVPKRTIAYIWWRFAAIDPIRAEAFMLRLNGLNDLHEGSPILALNTRLVAIRATHRTSAGTAMHWLMVAAAFYAWNAWIKGEDRVLIRPVVRNDGTVYMPELVRPSLEPDPPAIAEQNGLPAHRRAGAQGQ